MKDHKHLNTRFLRVFIAINNLQSYQKFLRTLKSHVNMHNICAILVFAHTPVEPPDKHSDVPYRQLVVVTLPFP